MGKPFLVFGMSRTGTTLLINIIKSYATERFNISEYFGTQYTIIDNNITLEAKDNDISDIRFRRADHPSSGRPPLWPGRLRNNEINERIEKLKKYKDKKKNQKPKTVLNFDIKKCKIERGVLVQ